MATFGLVHGAWHGAWCWERLVPELEARRHRVVAMDLPCDDPTAGCARYAEVVDGALPAADDLVLVGHSLGGLTIPLLPARRPVRLLVFLCAVLPSPGESLGDQLAREPAIYADGYAPHPGRVTHPDGTTSWPDADAARAVFYHDCAPAAARRAWSRLRRQAPRPRAEPSPLTAWPATPCASILGREDRAIAPAWSRRAARERLGVEARELPGGHSPFLARPAELAVVLDGLARDTR